MYEKYLPLGTIIKIREETEIMIVGYYAEKTKGCGENFDYVGIPYPIGITIPENYIFFNHDDIKYIIWLGYNSEQRKQFNFELNKIVNKIEEMKLENKE